MRIGKPTTALRVSEFRPIENVGAAADSVGPERVGKSHAFLAKYGHSDVVRAVAVASAKVLVEISVYHVIAAEVG